MRPAHTFNIPDSTSVFDQKEVAEHVYTLRSTIKDFPACIESRDLYLRKRSEVGQNLMLPQKNITQKLDLLKKCREKQMP